MAENYSLGSKFGLNVSTHGTGKQNTQNGEQSSNDVNKLFDTMTGYVAKYENVFNGNVAKEIGMYSRQAMIVGMNLKQGDTRHNFDINI